MHLDFDRMADMAARAGAARKLLKTLAVTMQKCVTCHTTYQLYVSTAGPVSDKQ